MVCVCVCVCVTVYTRAKQSKNLGKKGEAIDGVGIRMSSPCPLSDDALRTGAIDADELRSPAPPLTSDMGRAFGSPRCMLLPFRMFALEEGTK